MGAAPDLPPRFPCWCRATYSWGGETKKDLGFIEGDLIEALNAGDGSWWMGRLRRDPRAVGLFPSNFVKVLDEGFQPAPNSRNASPLTQAFPKSQAPTPAPTKSVFRKPFQAYETLGPRRSLENSREGTPESEKGTPKKEKSKFRPYASMKTAQAPTSSLRKQQSGAGLVKRDDGPRIPDPLPRRNSRAPRVPSPAPPPPPASSRMGPSAPSTPAPGYGQPGHGSLYRSRSPQPNYRAPSPSPSRPHSPLPATYHDGSAYPQLLPASRQPSPNPYQQDYDSRAPSPVPPFGYSRSASPAIYEDDPESSPPPPPPAHTVAYQPSRAPSPQPHRQYSEENYGRNRSITPVPPSPGAGSHGMTPSPLRDAMNDVMTSLQDMSFCQDTADDERVPSEPEGRESMVWSPDEYELVRKRSQLQHQRANIGPGAHFGDPHGSRYAEGPQSRTPSLPSSRDGPPKLASYVQRMEHQLRQTQSFSYDIPPTIPLKGSQYPPSSRPTTGSSQSSHGSFGGSNPKPRPDHLRARKSTNDLGRTYTTKTNATNSTESSSATRSSDSTQLTSRSIMSGYSAGGFSATSAGSLARRKFGMGSQRGHARAMTVADTRSLGDLNSTARSMALSESSGSGPSYHDSHASHHDSGVVPTADWTQSPLDSPGVLGGMMAPKSKKSGFFKKMIESAKTTARTGAASARSTLGSAGGSRPNSSAGSPTKSGLAGMGPMAFGGGTASRPASAFGGAAGDMGLGSAAGNEWMQVRRDINRSNSLSRKEREERTERSEMLDKPALNSVELLYELAEGDEGLDGLPINEPSDFNTANLALVDKSTRFIQGLPPMVSASTLAQSYVCRPHRSDVQRLRAIFTWVAERITWEEDFEGHVDTRRVIQTKRGCSEEIAVLVRDLCTAIGLQAEVVRGYLKSPGEDVDLDTLARPNHWWNAVIVDGEWRIMDCALAGPTNPRRSAYSSAGSQVAEPWYFLARPMEICYTHIALLPEQQHIVPPVDHEILIALPCALPTYFRNLFELSGFNTGLLHLDNLEMAHIHLHVPEDVECVAETEAKSFAQDMDGDLFESGDVIKKKALAQAEWVGGRKRYTIKALLPGDEGRGTLKIYAGKRALMHSIKDNPHALALALPLSHTGQNPPYDFYLRHPTPHAQRHDLYVAQPQCARLVLNNTFVFCVRQHPAALSRFTPDTWGSGAAAALNRPASPNPNPYARPSSAMSMVSATMSQSGSNYSDRSSNNSNNNNQAMTTTQQKPAKLAIQTPSQKIIRLTRKQEHSSRADGDADEGLTSSWETVIKIGERGTWRGLVLADRSARWCVFAEWEAV